MWILCTNFQYFLRRLRKKFSSYLPPRILTGKIDIHLVKKKKSRIDPSPLSQSFLSLSSPSLPSLLTRFFPSPGESFPFVLDKVSISLVHSLSLPQFKIYLSLAQSLSLRGPKFSSPPLGQSWTSPSPGVDLSLSRGSTFPLVKYFLFSRSHFGTGTLQSFFFFQWN